MLRPLLARFTKLLKRYFALYFTLILARHVVHLFAVFAEEFD